MTFPRRQLTAIWLAFALLASAGACTTDGACKGAGCLDLVTNADATRDALGGTETDAHADAVEIVTGSVCSTGQTNGCVDDRNVWACAPDGESWVAQPCYDATGDGICLIDRCTACSPGKRRCEGDETVVQCAEDGSGYVPVEDCNGAMTGRICVDGLCTRLCELALKFKDYMGCEYWAVDLDNAMVGCGSDPSGYCDAQGAPYAVVVSNPHPLWPAEVKIWAWEPDIGQAVQVLEGRDGLPLDTSPIPAGQLRVYYLTGGDINGTMQAPLAFRVESSIPITAYQFNPLENVGVYSNDASLLLPSNVLGRYYFVMTREQSFEQLRSYVTIVATNPGTTTVGVTVTAHTLVGDEAGIGPLSPGDTITRTMRQYDVLNIESDRIGDDMTGTLVLADRPVAVFGGAEAANAPNTNHCVVNPACDGGDACDPPKVCEWDGETPCTSARDCSAFITCCADHLEQQMFPVKTWGRRYLATRSMARGNESDNWRIIASEDGTRVSTLPPQLVIPIPVLDQGEWFDFESQQDFEIHANKPVMVGQFLQAEHAPGPGRQVGDAGTGDPAFMLAVPVEQFRPDYVFLAPDKYEYDYVNIMAPREATVTFDGAVLPETNFTSFGTGDYKVSRFVIPDGVHTIDADAPVSVIVYGYDSYVSYGYPGGLNLSELNDEPGVQ